MHRGIGSLDTLLEGYSEYTERTDTDRHCCGGGCDSVNILYLAADRVGKALCFEVIIGERCKQD
jgi:hypothetical protein